MVKDKLFPKEDGQDHPTLAEYQAVLIYLVFATRKGHVQAQLHSSSTLHYQSYSDLLKSAAYQNDIIVTFIFCSCNARKTSSLHTILFLKTKHK